MVSQQNILVNFAVRKSSRKQDGNVRSSVQTDAGCGGGLNIQRRSTTRPSMNLSVHIAIGSLQHTGMQTGNTAHSCVLCLQDTDTEITGQERQGLY